MNVWILSGSDAHDTVIIGVFETKQLAELAKDLDEESYAFYSITCWGVTK